MGKAFCNEVNQLQIYADTGHPKGNIEIMTFLSFKSKQRRELQAVSNILTGIGYFTALILPIALAGLSSAYSMPMAAQTAEGNVAHGKDVYDKLCLKCHAPDQDNEGPKLRGVFGSKAATISRFNYSEALKDAKITWDDKSLNKWLADPDGFIADTDMKSHLESASDRSDVIAYLKTLK